MKNKKYDGIITREKASFIKNNGCKDIFDAYKYPSHDKIASFMRWCEYLKQKHYKKDNIVIYGFNSSYYTIYAFKNESALKITYMNIYKLKIEEE